MSLLPCTSCHRHVRIGDTECPFCSAALSASRKPRASAAAKGLKRAAMFALGTSLTAAACASDDGGDNDDTMQQQEQNPTSTASNDENPDPSTTTTSDEPSTQPLYGAVAPPDGAGGRGSGMNAGGEGGEGGGPGREPPDVIALYGAVPAPIE